MSKEDKMFKNLDNIKVVDIKYVLGIHLEDPMENAYCLGCEYNDMFTILLCKTSPASEEFTEEIENLRKYFNAVIIT